MQIRLLQLAVLLICLSGCIDRHTNTPAFYVWKSKLSAEDADTAYLNTLGVQKIYARMFDVDNKGNGAFPTADYSPSSGNPDFQQEVVPVIFITNQTILQCPAADIEKLARNCADRIDTVYRSHFNKLPNEYQFDCDWTVKTKLPETHPETKERSPGKLHHPPSSNQVQGQNRNTSCGQGNADVLRFIGTYGLRKQKHHIKQ